MNINTFLKCLSFNINTDISRTVDGWEVDVWGREPYYNFPNGKMIICLDKGNTRLYRGDIESQYELESAIVELIQMIDEC